MGKTKIEWTERTWNPITGCTPISPGCKNCYARRIAKRLAGRCGYPAAPHEFDVTIHQERFDEPLRWRTPAHVFVCSMGDLFHEDVPTLDIIGVFDVMASAHWHTFQVLTKRPQRMYEVCRYITNLISAPLPENIWLGVTAENQAMADERIPILLQIPAAVRFVSVEPMLEAVDMKGWLRKNGMFVDGQRRVDWVICGAETGPGARPMELHWSRDLRDQCAAAGVPFFFKKDSDGSRLLDGREWNEMPRVK